MLLGLHNAAVAVLDQAYVAEEHRCNAERTLVGAYKRLDDYMRHGDYHKARRDNPLL